MNKWTILITLMALYMGYETVRADDVPKCSQGYSTFGRLTCGTVTKTEPVLDAYFLGAGTLEEIKKTYAERFEKMRKKCNQKAVSREIASVPLQFRVQTVTSCIGKRGPREPCVRNSDCLENFCHPDSGTCNAAFTIPLGTAL